MVFGSTHLIKKTEGEGSVKVLRKAFGGTVFCRPLILAVRFRKQMKNFPVVLRTEYAVALLHEQNPEKAGQIREKFKDLVKTYPYAGDIESEWELVKIAEMDGRCLFCHSV